eukprot:1291301-Amorphochlora_amoeboformis.AAC.1
MGPTRLDGVDEGPSGKVLSAESPNKANPTGATLPGDIPGVVVTTPHKTGLILPVFLLSLSFSPPVLAVNREASSQTERGGGVGAHGSFRGFWGAARGGDACASYVWVGRKCGEG